MATGCAVLAEKGAQQLSHAIDMASTKNMRAANCELRIANSALQVN